jgi:Contractile injection system tube protein
MSDFILRPKVQRGAFIEYGLSLPPLWFSFQFNPGSLTRSRTASWQAGGADGSGNGCREGSEAQQRACISQVQVSEESISLNLTLDASDAIADGTGLGAEFGIAPQLSVLELMIYPKTDELFGFPIGNLVGGASLFGAAQAKAIPILMFIWGKARTFPVVMTSLSITEEEHFPDLSPKRATAAVQLKVLEGFNPPYLYTHGWRTALAAMNLANL